MRKLSFLKNQMKLSSKPKVKFGFPVSSHESDSDSPKESQKGIAIIIALMIITFMVGFMTDLVLSSRVSNQMSINIEEKGKAEYLAKSGVNFAKFIILIDWGLDLFMKNTAKQEVSDGRGDFWSMLNGLPIGSGEAKMMAQMQESFELSEVMDSKVMNQLDLFAGQFVIDVQDEDSKININYLVKENMSKGSVYPMLTALFSCPAEKEFLDKKDLTPEQLAARIADYIDADKRVKAGADYTDESNPYSDRDPKHQPKNLPLDSLEELKLIDGWDDELHAIFSPYLTVYPIIKEYYGSLKAADLQKMSTINVNTGSRAFLGCLFAEMDLDCQENFALKFKKLNEDKENLSDGKNIKEALRDLACYEKGDDLDKSSWFKANSSTFSIKVQGFVGDQESEVNSIVYRIDPSVMKKNKLEQASDLLYWKQR
jgi:type II secretory pathway component PulK